MGERQSQKNRILHLLLAANGREVSLPEILDLRISQYSARLHELRRDGYLVENRTERDPATGQIHSWFRIPAGNETSDNAAPTPRSSEPSNVSAKKPAPSPFERAREKDLQHEAERFPLLAEVGR